MSDFKTKVAEDVKQYRDYVKKYQDMTSEDGGLGYALTIEGHSLADRWIDITLEISKAENSSLFEQSKTDLCNWAHKHVSQLHRMAEHSRLVWNNNEKFHKELELIDRRRS